MRIKIILAMIGWLIVSLAMAQTPKNLAELAAYTGPDREKILIDGAKKEGTLTLYTSFSQKDIPPLTDAFEKKYGIKINVWRAGSDKVLQRTVTEAAAKRYDADVIHIGSPEMDALHLEKVLQPINSPAFKKLIPGVLPAHHEWVATRLTAFVQAFNTNLVKKEDMPKTWQDLTDPKWKGKLAIEYTDDEWFYTLVQALGEEKGLKLFRDIVATNGLSVRKGHSLLANLVPSGEVPVALTVYSYMTEALKKGGAPIDWVTLEPVIVRANGVGVARHAPHPHAALLFYDFMLSDDTQKLLASMNYIPVSTAIESPMKDTKLTLSAPALTPDLIDKWTQLYRDVISATPN